MGGNGTIGGGRSLVIDLNIKKGKKRKGKWTLADSDVEYPFTLEFKFPSTTSIVGKKATLSVNNSSDKVKVKWY
jgi:hypothetical protein